jgi:NADPH:quinone reductase-like Zn-dependent oxidoreductase
MRVFESQVVPMLERGKLEPVIDAVLPLEEAAAAHARMASNAGFGKLVLRVG